MLPFLFQRLHFLLLCCPNSLTKHSGPYLLSLEDWFNLWYRPIFGVRRLISSDYSPRYLSFGRRYGGPYLSGQHIGHRSSVNVLATFGTPLSLLEVLPGPSGRDLSSPAA